MFKLRQQGEGVTLPNIRNKERTKILLKGMDEVSQAQSLGSAVNKSINVVKEILDADVGEILLVDPHSGELSAHFRANDDTREFQWPLNARREIGKWVLESKRLYRTNHKYSNDRPDVQNDLSQPFPNVLCMPLINTNGKSIGVIQAANQEERGTFNDQNIADLELFARHLTHVIKSMEEVDGLKAIADKSEMLMTEIHHRLKNNLSTITSLIEMEIPEVSDQQAVDILEQTCSRIKSITEVHSLLYQTGTTKDLNLATYFKKVTSKIAETFSNDSKTICIRVGGDSVEIDSERTMTCGLILNELILNAYKHAFTEKKEGEITIGISETDGSEIKIVVSDNGKGIGNNFAIDKGDSMGCWVIQALADRLDASIDVSSDEGTRYALTFKR